MEEPNAPLLNAEEEDSGSNDIQLASIAIDSAQADLMTIQIKTLSGQSFNVHVPASDDTTAADLKKCVESAEGIAFAAQKMIFGGRELLSRDQLIPRGILDGYTVHLLIMKHVVMQSQNPEKAEGGNGELTAIQPMGDPAFLRPPPRQNRANILGIYTLARTVRWFSVIDGMILILSASGVLGDNTWLVSIGLVLVLCGYYGARLFKFFLIVPYLIYLIASVVYRFHLLYTLESDVYTSSLLIAAVVLEFYIIQRVIRLIYATYRMTSRDRQELQTFDRRA